MINPNDPTKTVIYCDLCCLTPNKKLVWSKHAQPATYDAPLKNGATIWAYVCSRHEDYVYLKMGTRVNVKETK
jgi:hypothetical protein